MKFNLEDLGPGERDIAESLVEGTVYGPEHTERDSWPVVRASLIRDLLRGVYTDLTPDPRGLRLCHVHIDERIDLDRIETRTALELVECALPGGLSACHARLSALTLRELSVLRNVRAEAVLHLENLHVEHLDITGTTLVNLEGFALNADRITVDSSACMDGLSAIGHGSNGALRLIGATIRGQLQLRKAYLVNHLGAGLSADGLTVGSDVLLDGLYANGHGLNGSVRLIGATISGQLQMRKAWLINTYGPALDAASLTAVQGVFIDLTPPETSSDACGGAGILDSMHFTREIYPGPLLLANADVGHWLSISPETIKRASGDGSWDVTGLTYRRLSSRTEQCWLKLLRTGTRQYSPQPYQQFAASARAKGDERLARNILIAQHDEQLRRSSSQAELLTGWEKFWTWVLRLTIGYGYRTWIALLWLFGVVGLAGLATWYMGSSYVRALAPPEESTSGHTAGLCQGLDLLVLTLETIPLIPLASTIQDTCAPTNTFQGFIYLGIIVILRILAWALLTLFVAGYTNIVRNPSS